MSVEVAFQQLSLEPGATKDQVRAAYHQSVQLCHPDRFAGQPELQHHAEETLRRVNAAKEVLDAYFSDLDHAASENVASSTRESTRSKATSASRGPDERASLRERLAELTYKIADLESALEQTRGYSDMAKRQRNVGIAWLLGGILLTAATQGQLLFWGAIIWGLWRTARGQYYVAKVSAGEDHLARMLAILKSDAQAIRERLQPNAHTRSAEPGRRGSAGLNFCGDCGSPLLAQARFCNDCGAAVH